MNGLPLFLVVLILRGIHNVSSQTQFSSNSKNVILVATSSNTKSQSSWPYEFINPHPETYLDCLYIFYYCTDNVGEWPENENTCLDSFQNCQDFVQTNQIEEVYGAIEFPEFENSPEYKPPFIDPTNDEGINTLGESETHPSSHFPIYHTYSPSPVSLTSTTTSTHSSSYFSSTSSSTTSSSTTSTSSSSTLSSTTTTTSSSTTSASSSTTVTTPVPSTISPLVTVPSSCEDIRIDASSDNILPPSGVYRVLLNGKWIQVYCEMEKENGWTVLQRRGDYGKPKDYFFKNWTDYRNGFGNLLEDHWIGLETMYELTKSDVGQNLLFWLEDFEGNVTEVELVDFRVANEENGYRLFYKAILNHSKDKFPQLGRSVPSKGMKFSTLDRDNDAWKNNCAERFSGAWWYSACHNSNINGLYYNGAHESFGDGVNWFHFRGYHYSLKRTEMRLTTNKT